MGQYSTGDIRNVLIAGTGGAGKTTLIDAMLFASGAVNRKCAPADGTSVSDFEKEEKDHKHSVYASVLHCDHMGKRINLIDCPGSPDLIGQGIACIPAVETVAVVINPQSGIDVVARRMMQIARERNKPRAIIVNKIDLPDQDLEGLVQRLQEAFGPECLPINLPSDGAKAVVECLLNADGKADFDSVKRCHAAILDQIVEMDDNLMEKYLGGEEPDYNALHAPFEKAMDEAHVVPILFTNAKDGVGVPELLEAIVRHFPSPLEGNMPNFVYGTDGQQRDYEVHEEESRPLLAHVFKVATDPYVGKLALFRVHQGKLTGQSQVYIGHNRKAVKLGHVFHVQGKDHPEAPEVISGDIGCVAKIDEIHVDDVLHDDHALDTVHLKPLRFPTPMYSLAVAPRARGDEQKISAQLHKLAEEDPTFRWHNDPQTHEVVISGLGELHLRFVLERMKNRGVEVDTRPPKIPFRESITGKAEGHHRHKKQTGGAGQFGEVYLRIEPIPAGSELSRDAGGPGFEFVDEVVGGVIPRQFIPAVEKGVRELLDEGAIAGYPLQDVRVIVYDGKHHPVDSKEVAFKAAGKKAFREAVLKARPVVLEPLVNIEVTVPEATVGTITGDLSGKRGRIMGQDFTGGGMVIIRAQVPLAEVMQYQNQVKSITGGQGSFVMEPSHYEPVPPQVQQQLIAEWKPRAEED